MDNRKHSLARHFRKNLTDAEVRLWVRLKGKRGDLHFRRQHATGKYIVDFYCPAVKLIVEVDGLIHDQPSVAARDAVRSTWLESQGFHIYRLTGADVMRDPDEAAYGVELVVRALAGGK